MHIYYNICKSLLIKQIKDERGGEKSIKKVLFGTYYNGNYCKPVIKITFKSTHTHAQKMRLKINETM